ncbi:MAG: glycosyltransferase family 4 protein [Chloroflexota bacterium]
MRVAIDARLLAYQRAGTATYIRGILRGLRQAGSVDDVLVLASRRDRDLDWLGGTRRRIVWTPCHHRLERWTLGLELAALSVEVVHSPDFIPPARLGRRWARVMTVHDLAFLRFPNLLTAEAHRYYGQIHRAVGEAERIIAVSEATRRDLLELTPAAPERVTVIPEGVTPAFVPADPSAAAVDVARRFGLRRPYFLFVGTLEPRKNLRRLIGAFAKFRQRVGEAGPTLVLAGRPGWLADDLEELARPLGDAVRFLGAVDQEGLIALYNATLALVLVSIYEGFGLPALEAMACGRACLVSDAGSLPEIVGEAGLSVPAADVDAISGALERLWDDAGLRRALGERGRQRAARFDWASVAQRTNDVYRQAAACAS